MSWRLSATLFLGILIFVGLPLGLAIFGEPKTLDEVNLDQQRHVLAAIESLREEIRFRETTMLEKLRRIERVVAGEEVKP